MGHLYRFRKGWQSEHLARYILSKFSFVAEPSTVSDDLGSDFFCTLFKIISPDELLPKNSFAIQIKSDPENIDITNKKEYLNNLEIPFFIGVIDKNKLKFSIYVGEYLCDYFSSSEAIGVGKIFIKLIENREEHLKMWEKSSDGKNSYILFPKVLEIDVTYDYVQEPDKIKELFNLCRLIQENISSKTSHEYTFKKFNNNYVYLYAGSTSIQHFRDNFLKRLAEVFHNLDLAFQNLSDEKDKQKIIAEFEIYKKFYQELQSSGYSMPNFLTSCFDRLDKLIFNKK